MVQSRAQAFQYGSSEGYLPLREIVAQRATERGITLDASQVVVTTGSQQAIDLITRVLVDPGDLVAIEAPTYLGALQVFRLAFHYLNAGSLEPALMMALVPGNQPPTSDIRTTG
jgi:DNA-binding transcriptional MocR family regulator